MAWKPEDIPGRIVFDHPVSDQIAEPLIQLLRERRLICSSATVHSLKPTTSLAGHYRVVTETEPLFVRITLRSRKDTGHEYLVSSYLVAQAIGVSHSLEPPFSLTHADQDYSVAIFPFIKGHHYDGSTGQLASLGLELRRLHQALRQFPDQEKIKANSADTAKLLAETKALLIGAIQRDDYGCFHERAGWAKDHKNWLDDMARQFDPYLAERDNAQCIHGELHLGNVIFAGDDERVVFADLEETYDAWYPPSFDLAYIIHRFCLSHAGSDEDLQRHLQTIRESYGGFEHGQDDMLRQVAWYNMALLIIRRHLGESISPEAEYNKFVELERRSRRLAQVL